MIFMPLFDKLHICPCVILYKLRVSPFSGLHLNYEKFKLCLQNTLNMLKTIRVYFGVLQNLLLHMTVLKVVKKKKTNKTKPGISRLSSDYFQGRVWLDLWHGMASWCGLFLCVVAGNLIAC